MLKQKLYWYHFTLSGTHCLSPFTPCHYNLLPQSKVTKYFGFPLESNECFSSLSQGSCMEVSLEHWLMGANSLPHYKDKSYAFGGRCAIFRHAWLCDWLRFCLKTQDWHKKYDFYQLTNSPRSWFPSKCSFSDHRGWLPEKIAKENRQGVSYQDKFLACF